MVENRKEMFKKLFKETLNLFSNASQEMRKQAERKVKEMSEEDWQVLQAMYQMIKVFFPYSILPDNIKKVTVTRCNTVENIITKAYARNYDATAKLMENFFETDVSFIFESSKDILHTQLTYISEGTYRQQTITALHEYLLKVGIYEKLLNVMVCCILIAQRQAYDYEKIRKMGLSRKMKIIENTENKDYLTLIDGCDVNLRNAIAHSKYELEEKDGKIASIKFRYFTMGKERQGVISARDFAINRLESIRSLNGSILFSILPEVIRNLKMCATNSTPNY